MIRKIVVDSLCPLEEEWMEEYGIQQVPLTVRLGEEEYRDDAGLDKEAYLRRIEEGGQPSTAAPPPMAFVEACRGAEECFVICCSDKLSGSYNSAVVASQYLEGEGVKLHVFNSLSAGPAEASLAIFIGERVKEGLPFDDIVERGEARIHQITAYAVLADVTHAVQSGRMPAFVAGFMSTLSLVVTLTTEGGKLKIQKIGRGMMKTLTSLSRSVAETASRLGEMPDIVITHVQAPQLAQSFADMVRKTEAFRHIFVVAESGVMTAYAGRDAILLSF